MITVIVEDPYDIRNPIQVSNQSAMYHGTHSACAPFIEKRGFDFGQFYQLLGNPIDTIVKACKSIDYKPDGYAAASGLSPRVGVSFTAHYQSARGYAINNGSERIHGALRAAPLFCTFVENEFLINEKIASLKRVLKEHGEHCPTQRVIEKLSDSALLRKLQQEVDEAKTIIAQFLTHGHPVVYVVRAEKEWLDMETCGGILLSNVECNRIIGRIDYINGIAPESEVFSGTRVY